MTAEEYLKQEKDRHIISPTNIIINCLMEEYAELKVKEALDKQRKEIFKLGMGITKK